MSNGSRRNGSNADKSTGPSRSLGTKIFEFLYPALVAALTFWTCRQLGIIDDTWFRAIPYLPV